MLPTGKDVIMAKMLVLLKTECGEILGLGYSRIQWKLGGNQGKDAGDSDKLS